MISAGLSAPTQSAAGIAAVTASPALSYAIGQEFKNLANQNADGKLTTSQETAHILAHAVLGAAVAAAGNNSAIAGAISAGGAEAAAPVISNWLYNEKDGSKLTAEQKETVTGITQLLGTAAGATIGNTTADAVQGSLNAQGAVENNNGALKAIDKAKYIIIPAFGALYCSLDKQCTSVTGTFMGMLDDLLEENKRIEEENQRQLEQLKALHGESWIFSLGDSDDDSKAASVQISQTSVGSPMPDPDDEGNNRHEDNIGAQAKKMNDRQIQELTGNPNWHRTNLKAKIIRKYARELRGSTNFDFYRNSKTNEIFIQGNKSTNRIKINLDDFL